MTPGGRYRIKLVELLGGVAVLAVVFALGLPMADRVEWIGLGHVRWLVLVIVPLIAVLFERRQIDTPVLAPEFGQGSANRPAEHGKSDYWSTRHGFRHPPEHDHPGQL